MTTSIKAFVVGGGRTNFFAAAASILRLQTFLNRKEAA